MRYKNLIQILILTLIFTQCAAYSYDMVLDETDLKNGSLISSQAKMDEDAKDKEKLKLQENKEQNTEKIKVISATKTNTPEKALVAPPASTDIEVYSEYMQYYPDRNEIEATGDAHIYIPKEKSTMWADKLVFNRDTNIVKGFGNVKIKRLGYDAIGDYVQINLNEKNALLENPIVEEYNVKIVAKDSNFYPGKLTADNGKITVVDNIPVQISSISFGNYYNPTMPTIPYANFQKENLKHDDFKIKAKVIEVQSKDEHDEVILKGADIYYKKFKIATAPSLRFVTNKEQQYVEANTPEMNTIKDFGFFFGPGYVFNLPKGAALKVAPVVVTSSGDFGIGGIGRFHSTSNITEVAWGSVKKEWLLRGRQNIFSKDLYVDYAYNNYADEWFLGERRAGKLVQLVYSKRYDLNPTMNYEHRIFAGYATDPHESWGTGRYRYQGRFSHAVYSRFNSERRTGLQIGYNIDGFLTVYGTGDTLGTLRAGPWLRTEYKNWVSNIGYNMGGVHGDSPFDFDKYMYGRQNLYLTEMLKVHKYLSIAYTASLALLKDNVDNEMLQENRFYLVLGPEDIKLNIGYDTVRQSSMCQFQLVLGGTGKEQDVDFKKLKVTNPDQLANDKGFGKVTDATKLKFMKIFMPDDAVKLEQEMLEKQKRTL